MAEKIYVDIQSGLARVRGNKQLYARMLGLFLNSPEFGNFDDALAAGDFAKAADAAHAIKGISGNLGLDAVFEDSNALMGSLRQGVRDEETITAFHADTAETRRQVETAIESLKE